MNKIIPWSPCVLVPLFLTVFFLSGICVSYAQSPEAAQKVTVAVLPFTINADSSLDYLKQSLPDLLARDLRRLGFATVSQQKIQTVLKQRGISTIDLEKARNVALLSKAGYAVYGSLNQLGDSISLDVRVVEAFGIQPARPVFVTRSGLVNVQPALEDLARQIRLELLQKERIAGITVTGNQVLSTEVILMRTLMKQGDMYDPKSVNDDLRRVYELGYFDDVQVETQEQSDGVQITFRVKEKPRIITIDVQGVQELDEEDLLEIVATSAGDVMNPKVLAEDLAKIKEEYRKEGYYNATVDYKLESAGSNQSRLTLIVEEGRVLYIEEVLFEGVKTLDVDDLKEEMALRERGLWGWISGAGVVKEEFLARDPVALEAYYANHGFLEAQVAQPELEYREDGIFIRIKVNEGRRFKVGTIEMRGDLLQTEDVLKQVISLDELAAADGWFDRSAVRDDMDALTEYYTQRGYAFAETDYRQSLSKDGTRVNIVFELHKRQRVTIRRVLIEGNDRTRDNVIRRELLLVDGDLFDGRRLEVSKNRLLRLDYFETVDIETVPTANQDELDLKVVVKEAPTGEISGGIGYSTATETYFLADIKERNIFGRGYRGSIVGQWSALTNRYTLSLTNPRVNDGGWLIGGDLFRWTDNWDTYDKKSNGGRLRTGRRIGYYSQWNLSYRAEAYTIHNVDDIYASQAVKDIEGDRVASALYTGLSRDTTTRRFNPSDGMRSQIGVEYSGGAIGGDDDFVRVHLENSIYYPLWLEHVFRWRVSGTYVAKNGSNDVPVFERLYLGGINNVRGYEANYITPRDPLTDDRIGGDKRAFTNVEYIFPIEKELGLFGLTFFDAGMVWNDKENIDLDWKKSVGAGLHWYSGFGPMRLEYGYALDTIPHQGAKDRFEFSVGQSF